MCGIAALFSLEGQKNSRLIVDMSSLIRHRGPDGEGYVLFSDAHSAPQILGGKDTPSAIFASPLSYCPKNNLERDSGFTIALGHRRLAILDLSPAGHQPMSNSDSSLWITYNGEVYNYLELRKELEALGHQFHTQTDTEVILKAYEEWNINAFNRLNGMFAFVLYDRKERKGIAVRDRFGVKPLYYWISPAGFLAFASEIKQFTVLPGWKATLNGQIAYDFLNWGVMDHTSETFFSGVQQVRGGEFLEFPTEPLKIHSLQRTQWYQPCPSPFQGNLEEASNEYRHLLGDSIRLRLRSDVPVGSCLSGGLDSSSIVCMMNRQLGENANRQKTFSACSTVKRFDERHFIDAVVGLSDVDAYYTYPCLDQLFDECSTIIWHQDEPFASTSIYAQWQVFKLAGEQSMKVMLDGQGADEQLAGYHGFFGNHFYDLFVSLRWKALYNEMKVSSGMHAGLKPFSLLMNKLVPHGIRQPIRKMFGKTATKPDWLNTRRMKAEDRDPFSTDKNKSLVHQSLLQLSKTSLPMLLHYEDRDSMAHSIESRTPFLDYRLVEFTLGLPNELKIGRGWTKRVLRESMKNILPEQVRLRTDKMGFVTPEEIWLKEQNPMLFQKAIEKSFQIAQGALLPSAKLIVDQMVAGKRTFSFLPWRLISFGEWIERFAVEI